MPEGWATGETISTYQPAEASEPLYPGTRTLSLNSSGELVLVGGVDGIAGIYSRPQKRVLQTLKIGGPVTDAVWAGEKAVVASSTGAVKVFENGAESAAFNSHAGEVTSLAVHPTGDIVASVGVDKSYVLYDLTTNSVVTQVFSDACKCSQLNGTHEPYSDSIRSSTICQVPPRWPPHCRRKRRRANQDIRSSEWRCCRKLRFVRPS